MGGALAGKAILLAGGGNGSGRACALAYAAAGARVAIGDIDMQAAERVRDEIAAVGGSASIHPFDNNQTASVTALVEAALRELGRLDGLHCVAGNPTLHERDLDLLSSDPAIWEDTFRNHFTAYAVAAKAAIPAMIAQGGGSIINTSSGQAIAGDTTRLGYQVAKRGAEILSLHIAHTYGKQGIRCNVLRYGLILTDNAKARLDPAYIADSQARNWLGRLGEPQDAVGAALFLMSDAASFISGQIIEVAGGKIPGIQG
jgi:NAD(P)-dependent dehydrogenase (short-subunit alcohol dehydrogenase family)